MTLSFNDNISFDNILVEQDNINYWKDRFDARRDLIGSTIIGQILHDYYDDDSDKFYHSHMGDRSRAFPVLTKPEWTETVMDPDDLINSVEEDWVHEYDKDFIWQTSMQQAALTVDPEYCPVELRVRDYVWNDPLYRIKRISTKPDGGFSFDVGMTDYYTYVSHSTKVVEELYDACQENGISPASNPSEAKEQMRGELPERDAYGPSFDKMVSQNTHQAFGAMVTTLLEMPNGDLKVAVMNRSSTNVDFPSTLSIAPSGVFSPWFNILAECDFTYHVLREFGEEIFAREKLRRAPEDATDTEWVNQSVPVRALADLIDRPDGGADLKITGLAYNGLSLAPQLYALLYIDDPVFASWVYDHVTYGDSNTREGDVMMVDAEDALRSTMKDNWAPGGAVGLSQSLRAAESELGVDFDFDVRPK